MDACESVSIDELDPLRFRLCRRSPLPTRNESGGGGARGAPRSDDAALALAALAFSKCLGTGKLDLDDFRDFGLIFFHRPLRPFFFGSSSSSMESDWDSLDAEMLFVSLESRSRSRSPETERESRESREKKLGRVGEASETARG
jgi:hypothetical protein